MEYLQKLGEQITQKREQLNLTQIDLASIAKLSDATIRFIEKGKPGVSISNWMKVAAILGMEISLQNKKMSDETRQGI